MSFRMMMLLLLTVALFQPGSVWADWSQQTGPSVTPKRAPMFQNEIDRAAQQLERTVCGGETGYYGTVDEPIFVVRKPIANCVTRQPVDAGHPAVSR